MQYKPASENAECTMYNSYLPAAIFGRDRIVLACVRSGVGMESLDRLLNTSRIYLEPDSLLESRSSASVLLVLDLRVGRVCTAPALSNTSNVNINVVFILLGLWAWEDWKLAILQVGSLLFAWPESKCTSHFIQCAQVLEPTSFCWKGAELVY